MNWTELLELNELAKKQAIKFPKKREVYNLIIPKAGRHFIALVGARGVGKTVLLQQLLAALPNAFYIPLDAQRDIDLFGVCKVLIEKYHKKVLLIDEIHFLEKYDEHLKRIYEFLDIRVIFTSSVSLSLYETATDLSRRVRLIHIAPFSFREYLYFKRDIVLPKLSLQDIINNHWDRSILTYEYLFDDYLNGGLMPFSLNEPDIFPFLKNILEKVIQSDIPAIRQIKVNELNYITKLVQFVGKSATDGINYTTIAQNLGITKYKAEQYIRLLKKAFILNPIFPVGTNILKEPKVLMFLPYRLLYKEYSEALGALREDFFAEMLTNSGNEIYYLKSTRGAKTPDFIIKGQEHIVAEVGGKGKGREQFKGIHYERKIIFTHPSSPDLTKIPLLLLGFLY